MITGGVFLHSVRYIRTQHLTWAHLLGRLRCCVVWREARLLVLSYFCTFRQGLDGMQSRSHRMHVAFGQWPITSQVTSKFPSLYQRQCTDLLCLFQRGRQPESQDSSPFAPDFGRLSYCRSCNGSSSACKRRWLAWSWKRRGTCREPRQ